MYKLSHVRPGLLAIALGCLTLLSGSVRAATVVPVIIASVTSVVAPSADKESVLAFLRTYESTLASGRVERIVALYANFDPARRGELQAYFDQVVSDLTVRLDDIRVAVDGDAADVQFVRTDRFKDRETGAAVEKTVSLSRRLKRDGYGWQIVLDKR